MNDKYIACECCEELVLVRSEKYIEDTYYEIYDDIICDECILDYIKKFKK